MLVTRRMERSGLKPIGFVATDYAIAVWSLRRVENPDTLLSPDMMGDDLEEWMLESTMLKRSFPCGGNNCRITGKTIAGGGAYRSADDD